MYNTILFYLGISIYRRELGENISFACLLFNYDISNANYAILITPYIYSYMQATATPQAMLLLLLLRGEQIRVQVNYLPLSSSLVVLSCCPVYVQYSTLHAIPIYEMDMLVHYYCTQNIRPRYYLYLRYVCGACKQ